MLAIVHAAAAACVSKEGKEVAEKLQAKLNSMLDA